MKLTLLKMLTLAESVPKLTFHISKQMKAIFQFYAKENFEKQHQQSKIIKALYGEVTPSRKASISRTIKRLIDLGLMGSAKTFPYDGWNIVMRIRFFVTEKGAQFAKTEAS